MLCNVQYYTDKLELKRNKYLRSRRHYVFDLSIAHAILSRILFVPRQIFLSLCKNNSPILMKFAGRNCYHDRLNYYVLGEIGT